MEQERIILGIDPGTTIMGYGIVMQKGKALTLVCHGVLKLDKISNHGIKLKRIFDRVIALIDEYHPDELAIESPFFGKNVQSMLKLGRAQGVAIAAAISRELAYTEYAPRRIKQAITGSGSASKEQVSRMVQVLLSLKESPEYLDESDGLAAAVCHCFQKGTGQASGSARPPKKEAGWASFLKNNPNRKLS